MSPCRATQRPPAWPRARHQPHLPNSGSVATASGTLLIKPLPLTLGPWGKCTRGPWWAARVLGHTHVGSSPWPAHQLLTANATGSESRGLALVTMLSKDRVEELVWRKSKCFQPSSSRTAWSAPLLKSLEGPHASASHGSCFPLQPHPDQIPPTTMGPSKCLLSEFRVNEQPQDFKIIYFVSRSLPLRCNLVTTGWGVNRASWSKTLLGRQCLMIPCEQPTCLTPPLQPGEPHGMRQHKGVGQNGPCNTAPNQVRILPPPPRAVWSGRP